MEYFIRMINFPFFESLKQKTYRIRHLQEYTQSLSFMKQRYELIHKIAPFTWLDDKYFLEYIFYKKMKYPLNLREPKTFNEKINWIKLYDRNPLYIQLSDKSLVREYVEKRIGKDYLNEILGIYDSPFDIPWETLPDKFVIKTTHGSGWNIHCINKPDFDIQISIQKLTKWLNTNFYKISREWQYKNIKPRILIEKYIQGDPELDLVDYRFFCKNGNPQIIQTEIDTYSNHTRAFFDTDWHQLPFSYNYPITKKVVPRPWNFEQMLQIAKNLTNDFHFCRVDLYNNDGNIIFGEMTFTPYAGFANFTPKEYDLILGNLFDLNSKLLKK